MSQECKDPSNASWKPHRPMEEGGSRTLPQEEGTAGAAWEGPSCYKLINKGLEY